MNKNLNNEESTANKLSLLLCPLCRNDIPLVSIFVIKDQIVLYFRCMSLALNKEITLREYLSFFDYIDNDENDKCILDSFDAFIEKTEENGHNNNFVNQQLINAQSQLQLICFDHKEKYEAFCIQCYKSICPKCISNSHQNHKMINLIEFNDSIKNKLIIQKDQIKAYLTNISQMHMHFNTKAINDEGNNTVPKKKMNALFTQTKQINKQLLFLWKLIYSTALILIPHYPNYPLMILINKLQINLTPTILHFDQYKDYLKVKTYLESNYLIDFKETQIKEYNNIQSQTIVNFSQRIRSVIQLSNNHLCFCSDDHTIKEYDLNTKACLKTYIGHTNNVVCLCQLRDGRLVSGSFDHLILVWELGKKDCLVKIKLEKGSIWCVIQLLNDDLASGSYYHYITITDINTFESKASYECKNSIWDLKQFTNGLLYASVEQNFIEVFNPSTEQKVAQIICHESRIMQMIELESQMQFVTCSIDGTVKIWDMLSYKCLKIMQGHPKGIYSIVQLNSLIIAFCSWGNTMMIWNKEDKECITTLNTSNQPIGLFKLNDGRIVSIENSVWSIWNI